MSEYNNWADDWVYLEKGDVEKAMEELRRHIADRQPQRGSAHAPEEEKRDGV